MSHLEARTSAFPTFRSPLQSVRDQDCWDLKQGADLQGYDQVPKETARGWRAIQGCDRLGVKNSGIKMKVLVTMFCILMVSLTACINYRVGNDVDNPTIMAAKTGKDCAPMLFGLGFEPTVTQAMKNGGIVKVRTRYDTNTSFFGIGRYCHLVVGE
jgi:hypothetical protein